MRPWDGIISEDERRAYGAAGFGWMLYVALPPVVTTFLTVMSERRVTVLKSNQKTIIDEWGKSVTTVVEALDTNSNGGVPVGR